MSRLLGAFTSRKTTVGLLCVLAVLLLLNVAVPQAAVLGEEAFGEMARSHPGRHFVLVTLGLGRMPTSPIFLGTLGVFFVQVEPNSLLGPLPTGIIGGLELTLVALIIFIVIVQSPMSFPHVFSGNPPATGLDSRLMHAGMT